MVDFIHLIAFQYHPQQKLLKTFFLQFSLFLKIFFILFDYVRLLAFTILDFFGNNLCLRRLDLPQEVLTKEESLINYCYLQNQQPVQYQYQHSNQVQFKLVKVILCNILLYFEQSQLMVDLLLNYNSQLLYMDIQNQAQQNINQVFKTVIGNLQPQSNVPVIKNNDDNQPPPQIFKTVLGQVPQPVLDSRLSFGDLTNQQNQQVKEALKIAAQQQQKNKEYFEEIKKRANKQQQRNKRIKYNLRQPVQNKYAQKNIGKKISQLLKTIAQQDKRNQYITQLMDIGLKKKQGIIDNQFYAQKINQIKHQTNNIINILCTQIYVSVECNQIVTLRLNLLFNIYKTVYNCQIAPQQTQKSYLERLKQLIQIQWIKCWAINRELVRRNKIIKLINELIVEQQQGIFFVPAQKYKTDSKNMINVLKSNYKQQAFIRNINVQQVSQALIESQIHTYKFLDVCYKTVNIFPWSHKYCAIITNVNLIKMICRKLKKIQYYGLKWTSLFGNILIKRKWRQQGYETSNLKRVWRYSLTNMLMICCYIKLYMNVLKISFKSSSSYLKKLSKAYINTTNEHQVLITLVPAPGIPRTSPQMQQINNSIVDPIKQASLSFAIQELKNPQIANQIRNKSWLKKPNKKNVTLGQQLIAQKQYILSKQQQVIDSTLYVGITQQLIRQLIFQPFVQGVTTTLWEQTLDLMKIVVSWPLTNAGILYASSVQQTIIQTQITKQLLPTHYNYYKQQCQILSKWGGVVVNNPGIIPQNVTQKQIIQHLEQKLTVNHIQLKQELKDLKQVKSAIIGKFQQKQPNQKNIKTKNQQLKKAVDSISQKNLQRGVSVSNLKNLAKKINTQIREQNADQNYGNDITIANANAKAVLGQSDIGLNLTQAMNFGPKQQKKILSKPPNKAFQENQRDAPQFKKLDQQLTADTQQMEKTGIADYNEVLSIKNTLYLQYNNISSKLTSIGLDIQALKVGVKQGRDIIAKLQEKLASEFQKAFQNKKTAQELVQITSQLKIVKQNSGEIKQWIKNFPANYPLKNIQNQLVKIVKQQGQAKLSEQQHFNSLMTQINIKSQQSNINYINQMMALNQLANIMNMNFYNLFVANNQNTMQLANSVSSNSQSIKQFISKSSKQNSEFVLSNIASIINSQFALGIQSQNKVLKESAVQNLKKFQQIITQSDNRILQFCKQSQKRMQNGVQTIKSDIINNVNKMAYFLQLTQQRRQYQFNVTNQNIQSLGTSLQRKLQQINQLVNKQKEFQKIIESHVLGKQDLQKKITQITLQLPDRNRNPVDQIRQLKNQLQKNIHIVQTAAKILNKDPKQLVSVITQVKVQLQALKKQNLNFSSEIQQKKKKLRELQESQVKTKQEKQRKQNQLKLTLEMNEKTKSQLDKINLQKQNQVKISLSNLQNQIEKKNIQITHLKNQLSNLQSSTRQSIISQQKKTASQIKNTTDRLQNQIINLKATHSSEINIITRQKRDLQGTLVHIRSSQQAQRVKAQGLTATLQALKSKYSQLQARQKATQQQLMRQSSVSKQNSSQISNQLRLKLEEIKMYQNKLNLKNEQIRAVQAKKIQIQGQVTLLKERIKQLQNKIKQLQKQLTQLQVLRKKNQQQSRVIQQMESKNKSLVKTNLQQIGQIQKSKIIQKKYQESQKTIKQQTKQITKLNQQIKISTIKQGQFIKKQNQLQTLKDVKKKLQEQLKKLKQDYTQLQNSSKDKNDLILKKKDEQIKKIESKLKNLNQQNESLKLVEKQISEKLQKLQKDSIQSGNLLKQFDRYLNELNIIKGLKFNKIISSNANYQNLSNKISKMISKLKNIQPKKMTSNIINDITNIMIQFNLDYRPNDNGEESIQQIIKNSINILKQHMFDVTRQHKLKIQKLGNQIKSNKQLIQNLKDQKERLQKNHKQTLQRKQKQLLQQRKNNQARIKQLNSQLQVLNNEISILKQQKQKLTLQLSKTKAQLEKIKKKMIQKQQQINKKNQQIEKLSLQVAQGVKVKQQLDRLKIKQTDLTKTVLKTQKEKKDIQDKLTQTITTNQSIQNQLKIKKETEKALSKQLKQTKQFLEITKLAKGQKIRQIQQLVNIFGSPQQKAQDNQNLIKQRLISSKYMQLKIQQSQKQIQMLKTKLKTRQGSGGDQPQKKMQTIAKHYQKKANTGKTAIYNNKNTPPNPPPSGGSTQTKKNKKKNADNNQYVSSGGGGGGQPDDNQQASLQKLPKKKIFGYVLIQKKQLLQIILLLVEGLIQIFQMFEQIHNAIKKQVSAWQQSARMGYEINQPQKSLVCQQIAKYLTIYSQMLEQIQQKIFLKFKFTNFVVGKGDMLHRLKNLHQSTSQKMMQNQTRRQRLIQINSQQRRQTAEKFTQFFMNELRQQYQQKYSQGHRRAAHSTNLEQWAEKPTKKPHYTKQTISTTLKR